MHIVLLCLNALNIMNTCHPFPALQQSQSSEDPPATIQLDPEYSMVLMCAAELADSKETLEGPKK